jgi:hypothetical protein
MQVSFNESLIEVHKSKEDLHVLNALRLRPLSNHLNPFKVYADSILTYNEA